MLGTHHPPGRMQHLMEVVRANRRVSLGPELLDQDISMNPMARCERQELDDVFAFRSRHTGGTTAPSTLTMKPPKRAILTGCAAHSRTHAPCSPPRRQPVPTEE